MSATLDVDRCFLNRFLFSIDECNRPVMRPGSPSKSAVMITMQLLRDNFAQWAIGKIDEPLPPIVRLDEEPLSVRSYLASRPGLANMVSRQDITIPEDAPAPETIKKNLITRTLEQLVSPGSQPSSSSGKSKKKSAPLSRRARSAGASGTATPAPVAISARVFDPTVDLGQYTTVLVRQEDFANYFNYDHWVKELIMFAIPDPDERRRVSRAVAGWLHDSVRLPARA